MRKIACAAALLLPLAGCGSFPGARLFAHHEHKSTRPVMLADKQVVGTPSTDAGRAALDSGMPGEAIEKFQKALASGEPLAPALNGLAVAYARIERFDLAERFFREAISVDPVESRYQTNLAVLINSPALAQRRAEILAAPAAAPAVESAAASAPVAASPGGGLQRVSRYEVRIVTGTASFPAPIVAKQLATARPAIVRAAAAARPAKAE